MLAPGVLNQPAGAGMTRSWLNDGQKVGPGARIVPRNAGSWNRDVNTRHIGVYYDYSAAAFAHDGEIVAAAEERALLASMMRFLSKAISLWSCAKRAIKLKEIEYIVFYDKPVLNSQPLLETVPPPSPTAFRFFLAGMPVRLRKSYIWKATLKSLTGRTPPKLGIS